jgi:hypothetical protein
MRLLQSRPNNKHALREFLGSDIPTYAILSHTWGPDNEEVSFQDVDSGTSESKIGY